MQDKIRLDTKEILLRLAEYAKVKKIRGLAEYLGENENKLYAWVRTGNIADVGGILAKIPEINPEWLKTGEGPMLRYQPPPGGQINLDLKSAKPKVAEPPPSEQGEAFNMPDMVKMTMEILASDTVYRSALASNIRAFHKAVNMEQEMNEVRQEISAIRKENHDMAERMARMEEMLLTLGATIPEKREQGQR